HPYVSLHLSPPLPTARTTFPASLPLLTPPFFFLLSRPPPTSTLFPYTTLFRSHISMLKWSAFPLKHATGNTMSEFIAENRGADAITRPNWSAVFSVAFCVACLIIVEFLPVSLLTPMAQDLGISEGVAGQSVTVTAFVAMFASLFITQ